jgi:hypothetical protein
MKGHKVQLVKDEEVAINEEPLVMQSTDKEILKDKLKI